MHITLRSALKSYMYFTAGDVNGCFWGNYLKWVPTDHRLYLKKFYIIFFSSKSIVNNVLLNMFCAETCFDILNFRFGKSTFEVGLWWQREVPFMKKSCTTFVSFNLLFFLSASYNSISEQQLRFNFSFYEDVVLFFLNKELTTSRARLLLNRIA